MDLVPCWTLSGAFALALGCAAAPPPRTRHRWTHAEATDAALEAATPRALRCLRPGEQVTVEGFFDGPTGRYLVERMEATGTTSVRTQACVQVAMELAHTRPLNAPRVDARWTVPLPGAGASHAGLSPLPDAPEVPGGSIDPNAVLAVLRAETPEAQRCYEDALRGAPTLAGRLEVRFTLSVDGAITDAVASGPPGFRAVGHCILGHLRTRAWPAAQGAPVDFVFPYRFAPSPTR